jgi:very-short-patch-repair endonuclease
MSIDARAADHFFSRVAALKNSISETVRAGEHVDPVDFTLFEADFLFCAESLCASPIEQIMLAALMHAPHSYAAPMVRAIAHGQSDMPMVHGMAVVPQFSVGGYRADFAVVGHDFNGREFYIDVECDGHKFHNDKNAVARDRKRDRFFQASGWYVMRFTGSEIHNNPEACGSEVAGLATDIIENGMVSDGVMMSGGFDRRMAKLGLGRSLIHWGSQ